jgi:glycolate oxidase
VPETLRFIEEVGRKYKLEIGNIFHAGDGNLHPLIMFDDRNPEQTERTLAAGKEILKFCIDVGGSITGEHGVGSEKSELMPLLFTDEELGLMRRLHDVFNPEGVLNPEKVFPGTRTCMELRTPQYPGVIA